MGVRPISNRGIGRDGECGLCGCVWKLSWTHVPPECAGNSGEMHRLVADHEGRLDMSRSREGGLRDHLLCESCNNIVSKYDAEFGRWWHVLVADAGPRLGTLDALPLGEDVILTIPDAYPGAFIRSALAALFAVGSVLHRDHAQVAAAVLAGSNCEMPPNLRFRMAYCVDDRCHVSSGGGELLAEPPRPGAVQTNNRSGLLIAGSSVERSAPASIAWPPLWMVRRWSRWRPVPAPGLQLVAQGTIVLSPQRRAAAADASRPTFRLTDVARGVRASAPSGPAAGRLLGDGVEARPTLGPTEPRQWLTTSSLHVPPAPFQQPSGLKSVVRRPSSGCPLRTAAIQEHNGPSADHSLNRRFQQHLGCGRVAPRGSTERPGPRRQSVEPDSTEPAFRGVRPVPEARLVGRRSRVPKCRSRARAVN
jgi:hypothetical protein